MRWAGFLHKVLLHNLMCLVITCLAPACVLTCLVPHWVLTCFVPTSILLISSYFHVSVVILAVAVLCVSHRVHVRKVYVFHRLWSTTVFDVSFDLCLVLVFHVFRVLLLVTRIRVACPFLASVLHVFDDLATAWLVATWRGTQDSGLILRVRDTFLFNKEKFNMVRKPADVDPSTI